MAARSPKTTATQRTAGTAVGWLLAIFIAVEVAMRLRGAGLAGARPWSEVLAEAQTLPWLTHLQMALIGCLAVVTGFARAGGGTPRSQRRPSVGWIGLGLLFVALSLGRGLTYHSELSRLLAMAGISVSDGLLSCVAVAGALAVCGLMVPQVMASPLALWLLAGSCGLACLSNLQVLPFTLLTPEGLVRASKMGLSLVLLSLLLRQLHLLVVCLGGSAPAKGSLSGIH